MHFKQVFSDGEGRRFWNADPACCDFGNTGVDDIGYLSTVLEDVMAAWPVDPAQVFIVGHSNGAFMGYRMACERADLITAAAILAGNTSRPADACAPTEPVSMLVLHGTDDGSVPYEGMTPGSVGAVGARDRWGSYDGCSGTEPAPALDLEKLEGSETDVEVATGCPNNVGVELWTHNGVGHLPAYNTAFAPTLWTWLTDHAR